MIDKIVPTTRERIATYEATHRIFEGMFREIKELSKKKPDATLSEPKVKRLNQVLYDMLEFLTDEPEYKFLDLLDNEALPQTSDAVLIMAQFEAAIAGFKTRHYGYSSHLAESLWNTNNQEFYFEYEGED